MSKKVHILTPEQQEFASKNHSILEEFIKSHRLDMNDFYDVVVFGYLNAVQEYLERPELSKYTFKTIARIKMHDCLVEEYKYRDRQKRTPLIPMAVYQDEYTFATLDNLLPNRLEAMAETLDNQNRLNKLLACLTPVEKNLVYLKADGYTYREIAEHCQITKGSVTYRFQRLRKRVKEFVLI